MNRTIYTFWIGDGNRKKELLKKYNKINKTIKPWKIILGPTDDEHNWLINNNSYYKKSYENKIYALCADVYRTFIIKKNGGMYMDTGCLINENNLYDFLFEIEKYDYMFVLERPYYFWNGVFWIKEKNSNILNKCIKYFEKYSKKSFDHTVIMPIFFSKSIFKDKGYIVEKNKNILVMKSSDFSFLNNKNPITMNPSATWWNKINTDVKRNYSAAEGWIKSYNSFTKKSKLNLFFFRKVYTNLFFAKLFTYKLIYKIISRFI